LLFADALRAVARGSLRPQVILYAQLRDNSQGVIKITTGAAGRDTAAGTILVERETKLSGARTRLAPRRRASCALRRGARTVLRRCRRGNVAPLLRAVAGGARNYNARCRTPNCR
jgi:hypothetical protein